MRPKRQASRGPRPTPAVKSGTRPSKHYWHYRRCYPWHNWDYDWYDYDYDYDWDDDYYYDDYDYTDWDFYSAPRRPRAPRPVRNWNEDSTVTDPVAAAYQQGFKDGWAAAMDYVMYGEKPVSPTPTPEPTPPNQEPKTE